MFIVSVGAIACETLLLSWFEIMTKNRSVSVSSLMLSSVIIKKINSLEKREFKLFYSFCIKRFHARLDNVITIMLSSYKGKHEK